MKLSTLYLAFCLAAPVFAGLSEGRVLQDMKKVADWQLEHPSEHPLTDGTQAPFFLGLLQLHQVGGGERYLDAVRDFARRADFGPGKRVVHPDDHAVMQAWLELHEEDCDLAKLKPAVARFDEIMTRLRGKPAISGSGGTFTFSWCDTLFMSPPVWTHLSALTGDARFLDWADREWWTCVDVLYDPHHGLFYRDNRFFDQKSEGGHKVFWSRGNGWVVGGLVHVLDRLPEDHPSREKYLGLYHDMMRALVVLQNDDGLWRTSLLDPQGEVGESSGTAFFVYGMAWGLNRGLLPEGTYRPVVEKGWKALAGCIRQDGMLGYVQRIGDRPGEAGSDSTEVYGSGALLLAGAEIVRGIAPGKRRPGLAGFEGVKLPQRFLREQPQVRIRYVPERKDDFAFENDLIAFRAYGPALRPGPEDGGFDAWCKRVPYPVMDKWYVEDRTRITEYQTAESGEQVKGLPKPYHNDHGEGADAYKVGDSRGCGGISLWLDDAPANLETWTAFRIVEDTPGKGVFELDYENRLPDGRMARETKRVTIEMGRHFIDCESTFTIDGEPGAFEVAIGLKHQAADAKFTALPESGRFALWDRIADLEGAAIGSAILLSPDAVVKTTQQGGGENVQSLVIARTGGDGRISWSAGYAWEGLGGIDSEEAWLDFLNAR